MQGSRKEKYEQLFQQLPILLEVEADIYSNLGNAAALLHEVLGFEWTGFYLVRQNELVLGPFQGPVACTRIQFGRGVCGTAWKEGRSVLVKDVDQFPGYIACSGNTKSEIVVPLFNEQKEIWSVLDIDSEQLEDFGEDDREALERIGEIISSKTSMQPVI